VSEVLVGEKTVFPVSDNLSFEYELKKGEDLISIPNPKEQLDEQGALKDDFLYTLPQGAYGDRRELNNLLKVRTENGQEYQLSPKTPYTLLPLTSGSDYSSRIPAGTLLTKKGAVGNKYVLVKNLTLIMTPPQNTQTAIKLYPQTKVERIVDPGTSSVGTTITVEPQKAPLGGYIKLTVKKGDFDFHKAHLNVCFRLRNEIAPGSNAFFASDNVELIKAEDEEAIIKAHLPENFGGLGGAFFAKPVDLLVVARNSIGDKETKAEVITRQFYISSKTLAVLIWILAFIIPWFLTAFVTSRIQKNKLRANINPIWIVSGKVGGASLSLAQILLWSILVFSASFYVLVVSGRLLDLTSDVLVLLGIAGGASVIAKITASTKDGKGQAISGAMKEPKWLDLIKTEGRPDLYKFQMALFTALAAVFVTKEIYSTMEFPTLPVGLLTLIGISNGVYLTAKASSKSVFEELAEIDRERQKAEENLKKLKNEETKLNNTVESDKGILKNAEAALIETRTQLEAAINAGDKQKEDALRKKVEKQEADKTKAKSDYDKQEKERDRASQAVSEEQDHLNSIVERLQSKKEQALQQD